METAVEFQQVGLQTRQANAIAHARAVYAALKADMRNPKGVLRTSVADGARLTLIGLTECLALLGQKGPPRKRGYQSKLNPTSVIRILALVGREWRGIARELLRMSNRDDVLIDGMAHTRSLMECSIKGSQVYQTAKLSYDRYERTLIWFYSVNNILVEDFYRCIISDEKMCEPTMDSMKFNFWEYMERDQEFISFREFLRVRRNYYAHGRAYHVQKEITANGHTLCFDNF